MTAATQRFLKSVLYLAAILLLPGALIGAPLLWWFGRRNARRTSQQPPFSEKNRQSDARPASVNAQLGLPAPRTIYFWRPVEFRLVGAS